MNQISAKISTKIAPRYLLIIGPDANKLLELYDISKIQIIVFQGNLPCNLKDIKATIICNYPDNRPAVNDNNSKEFFMSLSKECIIYVVSSKEALMPENRITTELMIKEEHSVKQQELVSKSAFKNLWGRMNPKSIYAKYGFGLFVGKSANYNAIKELWISCGKPYHKPSCDLIFACISYAEQLENTSKISIPDSFINRLIEAQTCLAAIAGGYEPLNKDGDLIVSSDPTGKIQYNISKDYPDIYDKFKKKGLFSPAYDLIAAKLLINTIGTINLKKYGLLIVTDPGQDPDDQLALFHLHKRGVLINKEQLIITGKGNIKAWVDYLYSF